jgi:hypothetical protein
MATGTALGATLHYYNAGYVAIAGLGDFTFPFGECEELDTTTHGSTKKEFEPGIVDLGTLSVPLTWDDAATSHVWLLANIHTQKQFKYTPKDGNAVIFLANIKSLEIQNPRGTGPKIRTLVLRLSGGTLV